ncbi:hypothetical protein [Paucibacter soli]|uniref:hypothetical protein n=1 Tax=Paucibacter soli TaxID=3133433 RepID=UPI0030B78014
MNALLRLPAAILHLAFSVLFFRPAFALLPNRVRWSSAGFIAMAALYFAASLARHGYFSSFPLEGLIVGRLMFLGFLLLFFGGQRLAELTRLRGKPRPSGRGKKAPSLASSQASWHVSNSCDISIS